MEMAYQQRKNIFLLLVDYEKAFDFANRATIIKDMVQKGIGSTFAKALGNMYCISGYIPKVDRNTLGSPIMTVELHKVENPLLICSPF